MFERHQKRRLQSEDHKEKEVKNKQKGTQQAYLLLVYEYH